MTSDPSIFSGDGLPFEDGNTYRVECGPLSNVVEIYRRTLAGGWDLIDVYEATSTAEPDIIVQISLRFVFV